MESSQDKEIASLKRMIYQLHKTSNELRTTITGQEHQIRQLQSETREETKKQKVPPPQTGNFGYRPPPPPSNFGNTFDNELEAAIQMSMANAPQMDSSDALEQALALSMVDNENFAKQEEDALENAIAESMSAQEADPLDSMSYEQILSMEEEMGSVSKGLSEDQISSLRTFRYYKTTPDFCSICQGGLMRGIHVKELRCEHLFHSDCIDQWLRIKRVCAVCQEEVL